MELSKNLLGWIMLLCLASSSMSSILDENSDSSGITLYILLLPA
jgi:hypothetical protein